MTKRLLSLLLALLMLLSVVPVQVLAVEGDPLAQSGNDEGQIIDNFSNPAEPGLEEAVSANAFVVCPEQVTYLQEQINGIMLQYAVYAEMTDEEIAGAIAAVDGETLSATMNRIDAIGQEIANLSEEDFAWLDLALYNRFCSVLGQMNTPVVAEERSYEPEIDNYESFLYHLALLEELATIYVEENPGKDPLALVIKYIRTGVDRYNSGSWGIMAGYEDPAFAEFVAMMEAGINQEMIDAGYPEEELLKITGLKNLKNFDLPNGDRVDFGHMFGTMDISYHNKGSVNHADVAGWCGDLVDLLSVTDRHGVTGTLEEMVADISANYLNKTVPGESDQFGLTDMYGDLDGFYLIESLYQVEYENGTLMGLMMEYFTEDLTDESRAAFLLKNRLGDVSLRSAIRDAVYNAYTGNKVITTLEATREFVSPNLDMLRKACCYAFADYLCKLAGDYVENVENFYYTVFSSENLELAPGITQDIKYATTSDNNQIVYYIATADITRDDVHVFANYNENDPSKGWRMSRVIDQANAAQAKYGDSESPNYIPNYNVIASTNGAGFDMGTGEPGGLLVMGGVEYHPVNSSGFFGILKDGTPVIGTTEEYNTIYKGQVQEGVAGFGTRLIRNGEICTTDNKGRAPRTAVGITATGKVVLMVLDGRGAPWSVGGSMTEIAQIMYEAGCVDAVNLDGGGSTTYVARQPGEDELTLINKPSDGAARSVSTSLMMVSTAPNSTAFDHALIESDYRYLTMGASIQMTARGVSATGNTAELPEGAYWAVSNENYAAITEDGVLTALRANGSVDVYLMVGDQVVGSKSVSLVLPDNIYFTRENINAVYGQSVEMPIKTLYQGKEVSFTANDVVFAVEPANAGTMDGFLFTSYENISYKNVKITAVLPDGSKSDMIEISLYKQGEMTFDFDRATGGDRQMAWDRQVSNATTEDALTYEVVEPGEDMVTSYTFAIDMTQIPIPKVLHDLVYMLPGADQVEVENATAWGFLLNLAERVSVLTEVKPTMTFDKSFDVNFDDMKIINEYFTLTGQEFDEETNTLTLTLNWIDQTQAIDPAVANPLCIVSGIKLTPKADVDWGERGQLTVSNSGSISYKAYMRASALHSLALKPEAQEQYQIHPYVNPDNSADAGAWFGDTYKQFTDTYKLVNEVRKGWFNEEGGFAYYVDGERLIGVHQIDGLYYGFDENGINVGKTPYSGLFENNGNAYYAILGETQSGWHNLDNVWHFFDWSTGIGRNGTYTTTMSGIKVTYIMEKGRMVKGYWHQDDKGLQYFDGPRHVKNGWVTVDGDSYFFDDYYACTGISPIYQSHDLVPTWYEFTETGVMIGLVADGFYHYEGNMYYVENGKSHRTGVYLIDDNYYFFSSKGIIFTDMSVWISNTNGLLTAGTYRIGSDGKIDMSTGLSNENGTLYYYKNGLRTANAGLLLIDGDYYYIGSGAIAVTNTTVWVTRTNGLKPVGSYIFGADGKMIVYQGVVDGYYYVNGSKTAAGLVCENGDYYYAEGGGKLVTNKNYWISKHNGLLPVGTYRFGADGKINMSTSLDNENGTLYYYKDGLRTANAGLLLIDGDYYHIGSGAIASANATIWVSKTNGLKTAGTYRFGADGKMILTTEIVDENGILYYYKDGKRTASAGLVEFEGALYHIDGGAKAQRDVTIWVSKPNGLKPVGSYTFGSDGKMVIHQGVVNGYYYVDGVKTSAGLICENGDYYYAEGGGKLVVNKSYWITRANNLLPVGTYRFGADGKIDMSTGLVNENGTLYYYENGLRKANAGILNIDGDYYYVASGAIAVTNKSVWVSKPNGHVTVGTYRFGADGKMILTTEIVDENGILYYYKNGKRTASAGLVEYEGAYYHIDGGAKAQTNITLWVSKPNGLWPVGSYSFGADGKMIIYHGIHNGYYYEDGIKTSAGLICVDGDYYFAEGGGKLIVNKSYWVSRTNGLLTAGTYRFGADGKINMSTELVNEGGTLYYYKDGLRTGNAGLILIDGDYYYIASGAKAVVGQRCWVSKTNGLPIAVGSYEFGADGKMIIG